MPAFDLLNFNWNITPADHEGNGDPFRYLWYRKKTHTTDNAVTTLHTTVEVGVDGYYDGIFDPSLTLVQYSSAKDGAGQTIEDSIQLNVASSDVEGDVATLDALFGETWREFLSQVSHAAQEKHALAVDNGDLAEPAGEGASDDVTELLTTALEMSKAAASPDHDEYDDALGGLFGEFEGTSFGEFEDESAGDVDEWEIDPNAGLELRDYGEGTGAVRPGVSRRLSLDVQAPEPYIEDSPTEVMNAVVIPPADESTESTESTGGAESTESAESNESAEAAESSESAEAAESSEGTGDTARTDEDEKDDALPADLQAVLDKYGPDVLEKLLDK